MAKTYMRTLNNTQKGTIQKYNPMTINTGEITKNVYGKSTQIHTVDKPIHYRHLMLDKSRKNTEEPRTSETPRKNKMIQTRNLFKEP